MEYIASMEQFEALRIAIEDGYLSDFTSDAVVQAAFDLADNGAVVLEPEDRGPNAWFNIEATDKGQRLYTEAMQMFNPYPDE